VPHYVCLVHYHELGLKGHNRRGFEQRLIANIKRALAPAHAGSRVLRIAGREIVEAQSLEEAQAVARIVEKIPGVARVSCGLRCERELESMCAAALALLEAFEPYTSFKVDARRANTDYPISSMELNQRIGAWLCEHLPDKTVRMHDPDAKVHVEVIQGSAYVYVWSERAIGGLPVGSAGKVVSLLSAGMDSPVATWRMMKRGATVIGLHFSGKPEIADASDYLLQRIAEALEPAGGLKRIYSVPFGSYQRQIAHEVPSALRVLFYRRLMFAVANAVARRNGAKALVTGESLGQVASQTLDNIRATNAVAAYPVLRPLIGSDKQEIIDEAKRLGTYEISAKDHDDCCTLFMPRSPETHAKLPEVEAVWATLPIDDWVTAIIGSLEVIYDRNPAAKDPQ
jgi:thiamine biosynthesis protein ThiI